MTVRHVDDERRRRLLVGRQLLAGDRSAHSIDDVAGQLALLHSTDPSTPYLSIAARSDASVAEIDSWCYDDRAMLRHTTIRRTVFVMPLDVVAVAHGAVNGPIVAKLRSQLVGWIDATPDTDEPGDRFLDAVERQVVTVLRQQGPMTGTSLADEVPGLRLQFEPAPGKSYSKRMRITSKVLEILAAEGRICRGRPTGRDLTSGSWTWEAIEDRLPGGIEPIDAAEALSGLLRRHLETFGPATVTDLAWWAGVAKGRVTAALRAIAAEEVSLDGPEAGFVVRGDELETAAPEGVVSLLPGLDSTTMGWKQRSWYVDDRPEAGLFDRNGNAGPTVWLDGRVVGAWTQRPDGDIVTELHSDLGPSEQDALDVEIARLAAWLGDVRIKWRYPTPMTRRLVDA